MPNFTAEASLYRSRARYQLFAMLAGLRPGGKVVPAMINRTCDFDFIDPTKYCCISEFRAQPIDPTWGLRLRCCSNVNNPAAGVSCEHVYFVTGRTL
jgi:hypothetical protein